MVCWALIVICFVAEVFIFRSTFGTGEQYAVFFGSIAVLIAAFIFSFFVRKRTDKGHKILQKIEGFKLFLETAEKDRLEKLVFDDPKYFTIYFRMPMSSVCPMHGSRNLRILPLSLLSGITAPALSTLLLCGIL